MVFKKDKYVLNLSLSNLDKISAKTVFLSLILLSTKDSIVKSKTSWIFSSYNEIAFPGEP